MKCIIMFFVIQKCQSIYIEFIKFWCLFLDAAYLQFFGDDFLRTIILRYIFCDVVLRTHMSFRGRHQRPRCEPPLPTVDLLEHPSLSHIVVQLASALDVRDQFHENATDIE